MARIDSSAVAVGETALDDIAEWGDELRRFNSRLTGHFDEAVVLELRRRRGRARRVLSNVAVEVQRLGDALERLGTALETEW